MRGDDGRLRSFPGSTQPNQTTPLTSYKEVVGEQRRRLRGFSVF